MRREGCSSIHLHMADVSYQAVAYRMHRHWLHRASHSTLPEFGVHTAVGDVKLTWRRLKSRSSSFERSPTTQWSPPNTLVCSGWPGGTCDAPLWLATRGRTEEDEQEKHRPCSLRVRPSLF